MPHPSKRVHLTPLERNLLFYVKNYKDKHPDRTCYLPQPATHQIKDYLRCVDYLAENEYIVLNKTEGHYRSWSVALNENHPKIKTCSGIWK